MRGDPALAERMAQDVVALSVQMSSKESPQRSPVVGDRALQEQGVLDFAPAHVACEARTQLRERALVEIPQP
jgi:hypothetical protein